MNRFQYIIRELLFRRGRSIATVASIAVSVLAGVLLVAIATTYTKAIQAPMKSVGADVVVQLSGDIPRKLEGLVFPHPNALLKKQWIAEIGKMPGVVSLTRGVYFWELAPAPYKSVLGIEDTPSGLGGLNANLTSGKKLSDSDDGILIDADFAAKKTLKVGDELIISGRSFKIFGVVDAATGGKVIRADVYMPIGPARLLAAAAPRVAELYPFDKQDTNVLLVKVDHRQLKSVVESTGKLIGKKAIVSSELSFRETLESVLFLSERMGLILALVIGVFSIAFVLRATASAVNERHREMALLQAVGWRWSSIRWQIVMENTLLAIIGALIGLVLAFVIARIIGGIEITIELPWDLSSTPHFLPDATVDRNAKVFAPLEIPGQLLAIAGLGGAIVGFLSAIIAVSTKRASPWSLLCSE